MGGPTQIAGRRPQSVYARTRYELLRKLREANWVHAQGLPVSSRKQTRSTFLTSWLEVVRHRIGPSTYDSYELNVRRVSELLGSVPMVHISPPGIQDVYGRLSAQGPSDYNVLQAHRTFRRALSVVRFPSTDSVTCRPHTGWVLAKLDLEAVFR